MAISTQTPSTLARAEGEHLAYHRHHGAADKSGVIWLGGFRSDMEGGKALALEEWAKAHDRSFVRFDYFAHGQSSGAWDQGTIGRWREDALCVIDQLSEGPQILVGSSMGGWIALLCAQARPERIKGLTLIAPAPDFTETLMWEAMPHHVQQAIMTEGYWDQPSPYGGPVRITKTLIEEGRQWQILDGHIAFSGPVQILQGWQDRDVPWGHALRIVECVTSQDVRYHLKKTGDHRLSEPDDLARLCDWVSEICDQIDAK